MVVGHISSTVFMLSRNFETVECIKRFWAIRLQIPRGFSESDEEDELYEEVEDTQRQHSQFNFTIWYCLSLSYYQQSSKFKSKLHILPHCACPNSPFLDWIMRDRPSIIIKFNTHIRNDEIRKVS